MSLAGILLSSINIVCSRIGTRDTQPAHNTFTMLRERLGRTGFIETHKRFVRKAYSLGLLDPVRTNRSLRKAKRDRKANPTRNKIFNELRRLKINKYYEDPQLKEIYVNVTLKYGKQKQLRSFQVTVKEKKQKIAKEKLTDGLCVFVTNHMEKEQDRYIVSAKRIIEAYREKTQVEDAFKHIKSFVKIRPFFINTDEHVKAVYTVCILSYFINRYLSEKRKESEGKDYLNSIQLYAPFKSCKLVTLLETLAGITKKDIVPFSDEQKATLSNIFSEKSIKFKPIYSSKKECSP